MQCRPVLATLALPLAGCPEVLHSGDSTGTNDQTPVTTDGPVTDPERTPTRETDHVTATPEVEYALGEPHAHENWQIAVETLELATTFRTDAGGRYEMPAGEQLSSPARR